VCIISFIPYTLIFCFLHIGPETWPEQFPSCGGSRQSPIDINENDLQHGNFAPLERINYFASPDSMQVENNGHTIQVYNINYIILSATAKKSMVYTYYLPAYNVNVVSWDFFWMTSRYQEELEDLGDDDIALGPRFWGKTCDRFRLKTIIRLVTGFYL